MVIRVRPPLPREVDGERMFQNIVSVDRDEHVVTISENLNAVLDEVGAGALPPLRIVERTFFVVRGSIDSRYLL